MSDPNPSSRADEEYLHGYSPEHRAFLSSRTAAREAAFLLPHIKPGMRLLDCGCGMGALTTSLAEWLAPGEVIGFDREESQVAAARAWAAGKGVGNVRFEVGDIYKISYPVPPSTPSSPTPSWSTCASRNAPCGKCAAS